MSDTSTPRNKAALEAGIDQSWSQLEQMIERLTEDRLTDATDSASWTAKDHLAHIAVWERSIVYLLQSQPRHEGLGVEESVYLGGETTDINAAIHEASRELALSEVLALLRATHEQLRVLVASMSDDDLLKTYSDFLPNDPGQDDGQPVMARISRATIRHFDLHRACIEEIVGP